MNIKRLEKNIRKGRLFVRVGLEYFKYFVTRLEKYWGCNSFKIETTVKIISISTNVYSKYLIKVLVRAINKCVM